MLTYNGKVLTSNGNWLSPTRSSVPQGTIRFWFEDTTYDPTQYTDWVVGSTWTQVASSPNIWDYSRVSSSWQTEFYKNTVSLLPTSNHHVVASNTTGMTNLGDLFFCDYGLVSVAELDTSSATNLYGLFSGCDHLTQVPQIDTSSAAYVEGMFYGCGVLANFPSLDLGNATDASGMFFNCVSMTTAPTLTNTGSLQKTSSMFHGCYSLTAMPQLDTSSATYVEHMFEDCFGMETGILAMYNQLSTQAHQPDTYYYCFSNCGRDTVSGAAQLAQIPVSWGGTMV